MTYDFDLAVIGGGAAGLTSVGIAANLGVSALLVESQRLGGDCTWYGCVPSKTLIRVAELAHSMRLVEKFTSSGTMPAIDIAKVMDHLHAIRQKIYEDADHPDLYRTMGVEVAEGRARFIDAHTIEIAANDGAAVRRVTARYLIIATGSRPAVPPIAGLNEINFLTNETLFDLKELPSRLAVLGAGPVGVEMAQALHRLGSKVTLIDQGDRLLAKDDPEHAALLMRALQDEGIEILLNTTVTLARRRDADILLSLITSETKRDLEVDEVLVATGRKPNVESLNLEGAGVNYSEQGITINKKCRTSVRHIYACGDISGGYQFTHMAEQMAKVATANALLKVPKKLDTKHVLWSTFTSPNVAHLGASEAALRERGASFEIYRFPYSRLDRAITDGNEKTGEIKVFAKKWSGRILGVDIIGEHAGDLISEYAVAMRNGISLRQISDTIHPYPTYGLGNRRAADQWYARHQSAFLVKLIKLVFGYRGRIPDVRDHNAYHLNSIPPDRNSRNSVMQSSRDNPLPLSALGRDVARHDS